MQLCLLLVISCALVVLVSGGFQVVRRYNLGRAILTSHNEERELHGLPPMVWNDSLATMAYTDAERCCAEGKISHNMGFLRSHDMGQNLYILWGRRAKKGRPAQPPEFERLVNESLKHWIAVEKERYSYKRNKCSTKDKCLHYTQVIWDKAVEVGCGIAADYCKDPSAGVLSCNYGAMGNFCGWRPYGRTKEEECYCNTNGAKLC